MTGARMAGLGALIGALVVSAALAATPADTVSFVSYIGSNGAGAGEVSAPEDVAADAAGNLYVDDAGNFRIDKFSPSGAFVMAWGWGVKDGASQLETCTTSCRQGIAGGGAGQLAGPDAAGLDIASDAAGNVYVSEDQRIEKFSSTGAFIEAWGWGVADGASRLETCTTSCLAGLGGSGTGQFFQPSGLAVDGSGHVYVEDGGNDRIEKFSSTGAFIEAWGWGVADGASRLETCTTSCGQGISGAGAGQVSNSPFSEAIGLAATASGDVYVADGGNNRIDEFSSSGRFIEAWGWGVRNGAARLQTCTSPCEIGIGGGAGAGQLNRAQRVAVGPSGSVFVADFLNERIDEFTPSGGFVESWGWGVRDRQNSFETCTTTCLAGTGGAIPEPFGLTVDGSGNVYVSSDVPSTAGPWVAKFAVVSPPQLGKTATADKVGGAVLVRVPGSAAFVRLVGAESIPFGSTVDATRGTVLLTSATTHRGRTQSGRFYDGQFLLTQTRTGVTDLKLNAPLGCASGRTSAVIAGKRPKRKRERTLWGDASGGFQTVGNYAAATDLGTRWLTLDTCAGTRITVAQGVVRVTDFVRHRTVLVHAPHSYLALR